MARLILDPRERRLSADDTLRPTLEFGVLHKDILKGVDFSADPKLRKYCFQCVQKYIILQTP